MKKYLQYNSSHFQDTHSDVGVNRPSRPTPEGHLNEPRVSLALDLSGKATVNSVAKVTEQKGPNEQEAALDLSKYGRQEAQEEALDLTKPSASRPDRPSSQLFPPTHSVNQSHCSSHTPPVTRHSKSPATQPYSLLQAALNSNQPNAGLQTVFDRICQSTAALLEQRAMIFSTAGLPVTDYGRTIKPFSSLSSRPLGITRPHMSHPSGAIVQGTHKPIAITAPQPHNSSVNTKSQSVSDTTVSVTDANHSISSTCNQGYSVSQSNYSAALHSQLSRQLNSGKTTDAIKHSSDPLKDPNIVERYLIQPPKGLNHFVGNINVIPAEALAGFSCNQCSKTFKTKAALKLHTTVHKTAEERQYACTICGRRFLHRHHLVVHQRKHSGEKPFKCTACSKTFMAIFLLHKHLRKHARESGPVSQISAEQLKQLHESKIIPSRQALPVVNNTPVSSENNPVIVLDDEDDVNATVELKVNNDEGKLDRKRYERHKNQNILDMIEKDPNMILEKIKADLIKKGAENVEKGKDSSESEEKVDFIADSKVDEKCSENKPVTNSDDVKSPEKEERDMISGSYKPPDEETDFHIKSEDVDNTYNYIIKDSDESKEESDMKAIESKDENVETDTNREESVKAFPEYGSDDEVELDFATGELKVVGKKRPDLVKSTEKTNEIDLKRFKEDNYELEKTAINDVMEVKYSHSVVQEGDLKAMEVTIKMKTDDTEVKSEDKAVIESSVHRNDLEHTEASTRSEIEQKISTKNDHLIAMDQETSKDNSAQNDISREMTNKANKRKSEHESGNIFEKLSEMKDEENISGNMEGEGKSSVEGSSIIDKEVEAILGIIKQKLCENEEVSASMAKKPKLENKNERRADAESNTDAVNKCDGSVLTQSGSQIHSTQRRGKKKGKKVKCEICARTFHSSHYLVLHMAVHKRNPMLQSLKKAKDYQMKAMGFLNKTNVTCEICKKVFKFQKSLNSHMRVHSEKMIQTKLYRKAFRDFMAEAAPQSSRSSEKEKSQNQSSESESQVRRYSAVEPITNKDKETASSVKRVSCDNENINIMKDDQYDDPPIRIIIGEDNVKRYLCHACDNTYTTRQKLRMHALIHKDNCFLCDVCGKSFFRHVTLEKHISTHMLPRPHICEVCKKSFIHRSSLMRHKVVHEKPAAPSTKQQAADLNFEMKMLDTYTMLRHERMQKLQIQKLLDAAKTESVAEKTGAKYNPLDLTVRIKAEDNALPPVLSPVSAGVPSATQISPWNLSPPLITHERNCEKTPEKVNVTKSSENEVKTVDIESTRSLDVRENRKSRTESTCSESDIVAVEGHQVVKKRSRKTRVYQTSCRVCKEVFPNVMLLKSHMVVHNTVETHLYECHICRHRFTQSCSLLRHLKTSCQENRMKCVPCGRTFHRRNTFDQHMRLHQGALPNLDGSFYDKRPDEAVVIEERESDIENNNLSKIEEAIISPENNTQCVSELREELVNLSGKEIAHNVTIIKQVDGNDSDSDARTYLYSEGEVHSRYNSDFSDNDWSPPPSPKKPAVPQDLSITSGNMTLNLLSAVCSDIRNAEKEQELKRKELEEKQKELETIEILASLKRGAMQKSLNSTASVASVHHVSSPTYVPINDKVTHPLTTHPESFGATDVRNPQLKTDFAAHTQPVYSELLNEKKKHSPHAFETSGQKAGSSQGQTESKESLQLSQTPKIPSVIESSLTTPSKPKIPTVVLEVAAEAESQRRQRAESSWQDGPINSFSMGSPHLAVSGPHSAPVIPQSSTWNPHLALSLPNSLANSSQSAPVVQHSSSMSTHLAPFLPYSSGKSPPLPGKSSQSTAKSSQSSENISHSGSLALPSRSPHSTTTAHTLAGAPHLSRETTLQHEMSQMRVHYPAIQERLSLLMKAQVTTASSTSHSVSYPSQRLRDVTSANLHTASTTELQSNVLPSTRSLQNIDIEMPQDLSLKKMSQETSSTNTAPSSRSVHAKSFPSETARPSLLEDKPLDMLNAFPPEMPLPAHEKKKSESLKSLPSEISQQISAESKSHIPRSDSSRSLPPEIPGPSNNERKRSESVPIQPPLVPMHQCELCSRVLYNKTDLHLHMMEHGRSAGELYKLLHSNKALLQHRKLPTETPLDFTKAGPSNGFGLLSKDSIVTPPVSLDLSSKKSENKMKMFNQSVVKSQENSPGAQSKFFPTSALRIVEKSSPVSSSDMSDSLPSPSTPSGSGQSAANLDALRQELRQKIYARRRSQGLDDLKVEFKPPEPTEMTETEKLKLMYRRECNRQAAQRSRMRKKDLVDSLLEDLHKEEVVRSDLQRKMEALMAEKNFLLKVFKSHECVKDLVKPTENHSLFEALNCKEDAVVNKNTNVNSTGVLVQSVNVEDCSDKRATHVTRTDPENDGITEACTENSSPVLKEASVTELQLASGVDQSISEDSLMETENDRFNDTDKSHGTSKCHDSGRFHDTGSEMGQGDDSSETSDDTDSPILKLLTNVTDKSKDEKGSASKLIEDKVDNT